MGNGVILRLSWEIRYFKQNTAWEDPETRELVSFIVQKGQSMRKFALEIWENRNIHTSYYEYFGEMEKCISLHYMIAYDERYNHQRLLSECYSSNEEKETASYNPFRELKISMKEIQDYEASLVQHPRVKELIMYVLGECESRIPGINSFLFEDRRLKKIDELLKMGVLERVKSKMNNFFYLHLQDFPKCTLLVPNVKNSFDKKKQ